MSRRYLTCALALIGAMAAVQLPASGQAPPATPPATCPPGTQPTPQFPCVVLDPGGGGNPGGGGIVPCVQGQQPTTANPCTPPTSGSFPCVQGQQPTQQFPCTPTTGGGGPNPGGGGGGPNPGAGGVGGNTGFPVPCVQGQKPTQEIPCTGVAFPCPVGGEPTEQFPCTPTTDGRGPNPGGGGGQGGPGDPGGVPVLKNGFLNKVWKFNAEVGGYDAKTDVLNCTIAKILNLPKKFGDQDDEIVDSDSYILFTAATRVYDADGKRVPKEKKFDALLDDAETVRIQGKILPPQKWNKDEDDTPTPTVRAKKVFITG